MANYLPAGRPAVVTLISCNWLMIISPVQEYIILAAKVIIQFTTFKGI
jgi:hypothetical protein